MSSTAFVPVDIPTTIYGTALFSTNLLVLLVQKSCPYNWKCFSNIAPLFVSKDKRLSLAIWRDLDLIPLDSWVGSRKKKDRKRSSLWIWRLHFHLFSQKKHCQIKKKVQSYLILGILSAHLFSWKKILVLGMWIFLLTLVSQNCVRVFLLWIRMRWVHLKVLKDRQCLKTSCLVILFVCCLFNFLATLLWINALRLWTMCTTSPLGISWRWLSSYRIVFHLAHTLFGGRGA